MYNNGNSSKNVTGASVVDGTLENADFADNAISGDKIDAGIISNFQSTGIDDRLSTAKAITIDSSERVHLGGGTGTATLEVTQAGGTDSLCKFVNPGLSQFNFGYNGTRVSYSDIDTHNFRSSAGAQRMSLVASSGHLTLSTGNLRMGTAGKGIDFSGVGTAANILDDYEEGTWTPTPNAGSFGSTDSYYTKIGNMVTIWSTINDIDSNGSAAWNFEISGLPFNISDSPAGGSVMSNGVTLTSANAVSLNAANATTLRIYKSISGSAWSPLKHSDFNADNANDLKINFTYRAA